MERIINMERLTKRNETEYYYPTCIEECGDLGSRPECDGCDFNEKICKKLGEYEDTRLTPEQIKEIDRLYAEKCKELAEVKDLMDDDLISKKEVLSTLEKVFNEYKMSFGEHYGGFAEEVPKAIKSIPTACNMENERKLL